MRSILRLAALPLMLAPLGARAAPADFAACDGYSAPGKKSDGITKGTWLWGLATTTADFRKGSVQVGEAGIAACDAALADPLLVDAFWLRRAHLLQSKALHQMSMKRDVEALAVLDQSDGVGQSHGDQQFNQSIRLANLALRAIALYRLERKSEAQTALRSVIDARPWSASLHRLTAGIRISFEPDYQTHEQVLREQAKLDPHALHQLFWMTMTRGDFEAALALSNEVSFDTPRGRGGWEVEGDIGRENRLLGDRISFAGAKAYALATTGQLEASARTYKAALDEIEVAMRPPLPDSQGRSPGKKAMREYDLRKLAAGEASAALQDWGRAIAIRRDAATMSMADLAQLKERPTGDALIVAADFFRQLKPVDLRQAGAINDVIGVLQTRQDEFRRKSVILNFNALIDLLPRPETGGMIPRMRNEGSNILRSDLSGWAVRKADDPDLVNVRFGSDIGSAAIVEEAALLAAANHVAALGKDGFIVESTQLIARTINFRGINPHSAPIGYELRLLLRPIDTNALPTSLEPERWRIVRVAEVRSALDGKFPKDR